MKKKKENLEWLLSDARAREGIMKQAADWAIKKANEQLALYPTVTSTPDHHPYYWLGQKDAAKKIKEGKL